MSTRRRRSSDKYFARTTGIAAENLGPGDRTLQRIHHLNISEIIKEEAWWFAKFIQLILTDYEAFPTITRRRAIVPRNMCGMRTIWGIRRSGWHGAGNSTTRTDDAEPVFLADKALVEYGSAYSEKYDAFLATTKSIGNQARHAVGPDGLSPDCRIKTGISRPGVSIYLPRHIGLTAKDLRLVSGWQVQERLKPASAELIAGVMRRGLADFIRDCMELRRSRAFEDTEEAVDPELRRIINVVKRRRDETPFQPDIDEDKPVDPVTPLSPKFWRFVAPVGVVGGTFRSGRKSQSISAAIGEVQLYGPARLWFHRWVGGVALYGLTPKGKVECEPPQLEQMQWDAGDARRRNGDKLKAYRCSYLLEGFTDPSTRVRRLNVLHGYRLEDMTGKKPEPVALKAHPASNWSPYVEGLEYEDRMTVYKRRDRSKMPIWNLPVTKPQGEEMAEASKQALAKWRPPSGYWKKPKREHTPVLFDFCRSLGHKENPFRVVDVEGSEISDQHDFGES
jgi:hypothetical protein